MPLTLVRARLRLQIGADLGAWALGLVTADALRYDFQPAEWVTAGLLVCAAVAASAQALFGLMFRLYRGRYRFGSFDEVAGVCSAVAATAIVVELVSLSSSVQLVPRSVPLTGAVIALVLMLGTRYGWRLYLDRHLRPSVGQSAALLVFGAGEGADQVIAAMLRDPASPYLPVGILDDDPRKGNLRLRGIPVVGDRTVLSQAAADTGADTVLLAIPSAGVELVRTVRELTAQAGLDFKVLPAVAELIHDQIAIEDIRDPDLSDVLGRRQIELDLAGIAGYLTGKRVLVTGAGGSIGSELCRQLVQFDPSELIMLDRDESALHAVQLSITGRALLDDDALVLADIRDIEHLQAIFERRRPQVVFHAAALKHLTLLERHPGEAVKSNVWGSLTVLDAARVAGVERFVNISTDKAADATCTLGYSKRIAERLTAHFAEQAEGLFMSVRFGNVLKSRGSVLPTFAAQVAAGGPLTVTDPEVTRYFMTVQEAVQLVIQAGAVGRAGEVLVLDMGQPVSILDVARQFAEGSPRDIEIVFTGLRPGEKLHEDLFGVGEVDVRPEHHLISQVPVPPLSPQQALELDPWEPQQAVIEQLRELSEQAVAVVELDADVGVGR